MRTTAKYTAFFILLFMLLCGCSEKSFENKNITFKGASDFDLCVDEIKTLTVQLPDNGVKTSLSASVDSDGLSVEISENNEITLIGKSVGEYNITFTLSAKGYKPADAVFPVHVYPKELPLSVFIGGDDVSGKIPMKHLETVVIELKHNIENAELTLSTPDSSIIDITGNKNKYTLTAKSAGTAVINISCGLPKYNDFAIPVEVDKIKAEFDITTLHNDVVIGETAVFECRYPDDSYIRVSHDHQETSVILDGNRISVTSSTPGSYTFTVQCHGESYITNYHTFTARFVLPPLKFTAPSSLSLKSGDSTAFSLSGYPDGTVFSVSSGGKAAASVSGNKVNVTARAAGNDTLTVTAQAPGYRSASLKIPVTINAVSVKVSRRYDAQIKEIIRLINKERTDRGYSALTHLTELAPGCTIRAEEASEMWSHTRPNGNNWETVLYDTGVNFVSGGENLLEMNILSPTEAVSAWMASPGHKANILRPNFNATCVAIYKDGENYYYAQHFIER